MMHTGKKSLTSKDLTEQCPRGCCGHYTDHADRKWHTCSMWIGVCICQELI